MSIKKANEIFGYSIFAMGPLRLLVVILTLIKVGSSFGIISGGNVSYDSYTTFSTILSFVQLFLAVASIVMIFLNRKYQPNLITGYLLGLGAFLIECILPALMLIVACGMYMKAGTKIINENKKYEEREKTTKKMIKNTEWFYTDQDKENSTNEQIRLKEEKKKAKLENEIYEWKKLLESGEIDETTYREETNKLIEREEMKNKIKIGSPKENIALIILSIIIILLISSVLIYKILSNKENDNNTSDIPTYQATVINNNMVQ